MEINGNHMEMSCAWLQCSLWSSNGFARSSSPVQKSRGVTRWLPRKPYTARGCESVQGKWPKSLQSLVFRAFRILCQGHRQLSCLTSTETVAIRAPWMLRGWPLPPRTPLRGPGHTAEPPGYTCGARCALLKLLDSVPGALGHLVKAAKGLGKCLSRVRSSFIPLSPVPAAPALPGSSRRTAGPARELSTEGARASFATFSKAGCSAGS